MKTFENKPLIVVDRDSWVLKRLGIEYFHENILWGDRVEGRFRELKNRTRRLYKNVNSKTLESIEEITTAMTSVCNQLIHNKNKIGVILT